MPRSTRFPFQREFTISVGQTVAFVNAEGTHNVDGTAESNPVSFFLEETEGNIDGVCMGTVTFDVPGVYTYTSSIGVQPELGMTGTIIVDAETLCDVMLSFWGSGAMKTWTRTRPLMLFNRISDVRFSARVEAFLVRP